MKKGALADMEKKALVGETITNLLLWIVFLILGGLAVWFLVKQFIG